MKKYKKIILLMFLELIIVAGSIYALNTSLTNTKDNQNTKIIAESSDVKTVEVYVAGWDTDSGKVFSDEMLELLNVNTFSYLYWFPAGTIQVDLSKLSSATGSYSNSDEDWSYILECLKSLDTSALIGGYSEANANNDIVNYIDEIILDKGYTDGYYSKLKTAISETDNYPTSNHDNLHLDIRFNTITVSYYYSDNVQDTKIFIKVLL